MVERRQKNKALFFLHYFSLRVINYISHKICINWIRRERGWRVESYFFCAFDHHQTMLWLKLSSQQFFGVFFTAMHPVSIGPTKCGAHDGQLMMAVTTHSNEESGTTLPCVWRIFQWLFCFALFDCCPISIFLFNNNTQAGNLIKETRTRLIQLSKQMTINLDKLIFRVFFIIHAVGVCILRKVWLLRRWIDCRVHTSSGEFDARRQNVLNFKIFNFFFSLCVSNGDESNDRKSFHA